MTAQNYRKNINDWRQQRATEHGLIGTTDKRIASDEDIANWCAFMDEREGHTGISKSQLKQAYIEWDCRFVEQFVGKGLIPHAASLLFEGRGKGINSYDIGTEQAHEIARLVLNEFDKCTNGGVRNYRLTYEHNGSTGSNIHFHFVFLIHRKKSYSSLKAAWISSLIKARNKANSTNQNASDKKHFGRVDIVNSKFDEVRVEQDAKDLGKAATTYAAHELYKNTDSKVLALCHTKQRTKRR